MKLLEYEAKRILQQYEVPIPTAELLTTGSAPENLPVVLKSQVPVGGRGKAGGVVVVRTATEAAEATKKLFRLPIGGFLPKKLLAEELLAIKTELYISLVINTSTAEIEVVAHPDGGTEVEANDSDGFLRLPINEPFEIIAEELAEFFDIPQLSFAIDELLQDLYACFIASDALLLEINPLVVTKDNKLVAGDCKMELDDAAKFRHPDWNFEAEHIDTNFVTLDENGTVATIANGAGLAMATVDAVADSGMTPANFLDIGGGANEASVTNAFQKIAEYPNVSAIVINIFAGITRCDEVAKAIVAAKRNSADLPKLYIRLAGTNYDAAAELLEHAGVELLPDLPSCLAAVKETTI